MSTVRTEPRMPVVADSLAREPLPAARPTGFGQALHAEWLKLRTVRSTVWTLTSLLVLGIGLTAVICAASADWLASGDADESPGSFLTWGMMFAQIPAVVLGIVVVTSEYARGMITATVAAVPRRTHVVLAKSVVVTAVLFVVGTVTAFLGYLAGNAFLEAQGVGLALGDDGVRGHHGDRQRGVQRHAAGGIAGQRRDRPVRKPQHEAAHRSIRAHVSPPPRAARRGRQPGNASAPERRLRREAARARDAARACDGWSPSR